MTTAKIKSGHLYLNFYYYEPFIGTREAEDIVPLERIERVVDYYGVKGGFYGFSLIGTDNKKIKEYGRKQGELFNQVKNVLQNLGNIAFESVAEQDRYKTI